MQDELPPWVPMLYPKQQVVFNLGTEQEAGIPHPECATAAMISGPRYTGKTICIGHRLARHLWETPGARFGILHKTTRNVTDGGVLNDLTDVIFPEWIESGIGFNYTTADGNGIPGPKTDGRTRSIFLRVRNMWGGESELRIIAIEHDCEIEQKLKSSRWSGLWLNELANFKDPRIFTCSYEQLRMVHLKPWQHLWIADTNPSPDGDEAWQYKFFYLRDWSVVQNQDEKKKAELDKHIERLKKALVLVEIFLEDNLALTPEEIAVRHALHAGDPGEYDRDVLGKWTKGSGGKNKHFADLFSREIHMIEEDPAKEQFIELAPTTSELLTGWDLGSSINHGVAFLEKRIVNMDGKDWAVWCALREIESIGEQFQLQEIGELALAIIEDDLQKVYKRPLGWRHWTDDSAMNVFRPTGEGYDYLEILAATKGKIAMQGVHKPKGSVETRIRLLRRLLREKRFYVSSQCPRIMAMLENAARGTKADDKVTGNFKHIFDAVTYPIFMESADELAEVAFKPLSSAPKQELITVRC